MAAETSGLPEASRLERALLSAGATRDGLASRLGPVLRRVWLVLGWAVTLRLPGEFGYWLRARRLRTPLLRGFTRHRFVLPAPRRPRFR
ncbi:MAG TPA: hypothetical protein VIJ55_01915 [Acetobacteraceae bacterium]